MNARINATTRRTQQYNFEDGLTEVFIGALAFLGSLVLLTAQYPFVAFGLFVVGIIWITKTIESIRERHTYPRSGYLRYKEHQSKLWVTILIGMISTLIAGGLLISAILLDPEHALAWAAPIVGTFMGGALLIKGSQLRLARISFLGVLIILIGFSCSPAVLGPEATKGYNGLATFGIFFFLVGAICLLSGGMRFRIYLKENPLPMESNND